MQWGDGFSDWNHWAAGHLQLKRDRSQCLTVSSLKGGGNHLQLEKCQYEDGPQQLRQFFGTTSNGLFGFVAERGQAKTHKIHYDFKLGEGGVVLVNEIGDGEHGRSDITFMMR